MTGGQQVFGEGLCCLDDAPVRVATLVAPSDACVAVDPGLVGKWISLEIKVLAEEGFIAIEPLNSCFSRRLRESLNLVAQICASSNRLISWLRQLDRLRSAR